MRQLELFGNRAFPWQIGGLEGRAAALAGQLEAERRRAAEAEARLGQADRWAPGLQGLVSPVHVGAW